MRTFINGAAKRPKLVVENRVHAIDGDDFHKDFFFEKQLDYTNHRQSFRVIILAVFQRTLCKDIKGFEETHYNASSCRY